MPCFVSLCPRDGLVFLSPRWLKERYYQFYAKEYDSYYRGNIFGHVPSRNRYENIETICHRLNGLSVPWKRTSVLDVGSGMGWSLDYLRREYPDTGAIAAIESSEHCLEHLKDTVGAEIVSHDIDSDWHLIHSGRFNLVIMRHVLEHFLDPASALRQIREVLSEDGLVYIAVPDMLNPRGSLSEYWFRVVHTFYFSRETLRRFVLDAGLVPVTLQSEGSELWGAFRKADKGTPRDPVNVYRKQIAAIRRQRLKQPYFRLRKEARALLKTLVPRGIRKRPKPRD